jgi:hypothetical protein
MPLARGAKGARKVGQNPLFRPSKTKNRPELFDFILENQMLLLRIRFGFGASSDHMKQHVAFINCYVPLLLFRFSPQPQAMLCKLAIVALLSVTYCLPFLDLTDNRSFWTRSTWSVPQCTRSRLLLGLASRYLFHRSVRIRVCF